MAQRREILSEVGSQLTCKIISIKKKKEWEGMYGQFKYHNFHLGCSSRSPLSSIMVASLLNRSDQDGVSAGLTHRLIMSYKHRSQHRPHGS